MRCNQEQFDKIKPKLKGIKIELDLKLTTNFPYLTNSYQGCFIMASTSVKKASEIHETWNEEIFLKACGIMKKYKITKKQVSKIHNLSSLEGKKYIKELFPDVFEVKLELNKWYKSKNGKAFFNYQKEGKVYGFLYGKWHTHDYWCWPDTNVFEATTKEVEEALTKEAVKKYKKGDHIKNLGSYYCGDSNMIFGGEVFAIDSDNGFCAKSTNGFWIKLMDRNGIWATIIETITKDEAEKLLNKKII